MLLLGENADVEDNVENDNDNDCCFSDGSVGPETLLCEDLSSKLCVVPAGDETTIAKPDEEAEAKSVAICPMLPTPGLTDLEYLLAKFTEPIDLNGSNQVVCQRCTDRAGGKDKKAVLCDSVKRDLIFLVPSVLTLHLKRYQHVNLVLYASCNCWAARSPATQFVFLKYCIHFIVR